MSNSMRKRVGVGVGVGGGGGGRRGYWRVRVLISDLPLSSETPPMVRKLAPALALRPRPRPRAGLTTLRPSVA